MDTITVNGPSRNGEKPIWTARVDVAKLKKPTDHLAIRNLFLNVAPFPFHSAPGNQSPVLLPGTMIAQCEIRRVDVTLGNHRYRWNHRDTPYIVTLLIQAPPSKWVQHIPGGDTLQTPDCTCVGGEINLANLDPEAVSPPWPKHFTPVADGAADLSVHASGLSFTGLSQLPWENGQALTVRAPFHGFLPFKSEVAPLLIELDRDRLSAAAAAALRLSFDKLDHAFATSGGVWAGLELKNKTSVPRLHWNLAPIIDNGSPMGTFRLEEGELVLLLTDQARNLNDDIRNLATVTPESLFHFENGLLVIDLNGFDTPGTPECTYAYQDQHSEIFTLQEVECAYDAVAAAMAVRRQYRFPQPDLANGKPNPALLWGFVPLENGWAQLPFFNITDSIYVDLFPPPQAQPGLPAGIIGGAVSYGNQVDLASNNPLADELRSEQPWSVTLLNAKQVDGRFSFDATLKITQVDIRFFQPDLELNGFLWLGTESPAATDALPALDNWLAAFAMVPLRTRHADDIEPAPFVTHFSKVEFARRDFAAAPKVKSPLLKSWSYAYQPDQQAYSTIASSIHFQLPKPWPNKPLLWLRHPKLPAVQSLPLTQNLNPPNYPNQSRQLAPFELPVADDGTPGAWKFSANGPNAAAVWPVSINKLNPSAEWRSLSLVPPFESDALLPVASLSVPGLRFEPNAAPIPGSFLTAQYCFGLPYLDEIFAMSEIKQPADSDVRTPPPPPALSRDQYSGYWAMLSEKSFLAHAQGDAALSPASASTNIIVSGLAEPLTWLVKLTLDEAAYPGALTLQDAHGGLALVLTEDKALAGLEGNFTKLDANNLTLAGGAGQFRVTGGSLAAEGSGGSVRDQRGLVRSATKLLPSGNLETQLTAPDGAQFALRTALSPKILQVNATTHWQFWFRDLPTQGNIFDRHSARSKAARGVNDPAALSPQYNHLTGYEWRVGQSQQAPSQRPAPLPLLGFKFYPLTLEKTEFDASGALTALEIVGRLLLPWIDPKTEADRSNAIRLRFSLSTGVMQLSSVTAEDIEPDLDLGPDGKPKTQPNHSGHRGEWVLGTEPNETRLYWDTIELKAGALVLKDAVLDFFFWGKRWVLPSGQLDFSQTPCKQTFVLNAGTGAVTAKQALLAIDLGASSISLELDLSYCWGDQTNMFLDVAEKRTILGPPATDPLTVSLRTGNVKAFELAATSSSTDGAVQITWTGVKAGTMVGDWQLLPGMHLFAEDACRGFAAMSFDVRGFDATAPAPPLVISSGFAEAVFRCEWGEFLMESGALSRTRVFGSSAGSLTSGFSTGWQKDKWSSNLIMNGLLEVKNLISWPTPESALTLPSPVQTNIVFTIPGLRNAVNPKLNHARHTVRVLLNQHTLPEGLLVKGGDQQLFGFRDLNGWQTLAVVEHQLAYIQVDADGDLQPVNISRDRRWTALQEVRLLSPGSFAAFLTQVRDHSWQVPDAELNDLDPQDYRDASQLYHRHKLLDLLLSNPNQILQMKDSLIVEASAHLMIRRKESVVDFSPLEFLPGCTPSACASVLTDFTVSDNLANPEWLLTSLPFLGRLQTRVKDWSDPAQSFPQNGPALMVDPIPFLAKARQLGVANLPQIPLLLASWADRADVRISVSAFDLATMRRFDRLDPASVEESWFRLQTPPDEPPDGDLSSIVRTSPATGPARLGRSTVLARVFDSYRFSLPPAVPRPDQLPILFDTGPAARVVWQRSQLFTMQGVTKQADAYGFFLVGAALYSAAFPGDQPQPVHFPCATLMPPVLTPGPGFTNPQPVSLALSPYLGLARLLPTTTSAALLVSGELIATLPSGQLTILATQLWQPSAEADAINIDSIDPMAWARETRARMAPDSQVAVLRIRKISKASLADGSPSATVAYDFLSLEIPDVQPIAQSALPVRTQLQRLRFEEGQYGGTRIPATFLDFEAAPPQVRDVQPIRLVQRPSGNAWPWGISVLRFRVQLTGPDGTPVGVVAPLQNPTLWWQAVSQPVQFTTGQAEAFALPPLFRAAAIASLLASQPEPSLPPTPSLAAPLPGDDPWQPILPGSSDIMIRGARAGASFPFRHVLLRQTQAGVDVSGSVPVQHRIPRPVPLPANMQANPQIALRTWASFFEAEKLARISPQPADAAFVGGLVTDIAPRSFAREMMLTSPAQGTIPPVKTVASNSTTSAGWDGSLTFGVKDTPVVPPEDWKVSVELTDGLTTIPYSPVGLHWVPGTIEPTKDLKPALISLIGSKSHGDLVEVHVSLEYQKTTVHGYQQKLVFPLRVAKAELLPLPMAPVFVRFEDPEYNRRLISSTSHQEALWIDVDHLKTQHKLRLALDRREYNPSSHFYVLFSDTPSAPVGLAPLPPPVDGVLKVEAIGLDGVRRLLTKDPISLKSLKIEERSLPRLCADSNNDPLLPGEVLSCTVSCSARGKGTGVEINVEAIIVAEPVTPTPQSAYGLLRKTGVAVECVRFAWGPNATRIELVNPDDLRAETVRRRAIFNWTDTCRKGRVSMYAVQKIAPSGSTHFVANSDWIEQT